MPKKNNESIDVLKAILLLAVMLGHNRLLMSVTGIFNLLYTFHIPGFFFVAALLNRRAITKEKALEKGITYLYPHFIFFSMISAVFLLSGNAEIEEKTLRGWLYALISGNGVIVKTYSGVQYLWYLPAIYCFYLTVGLFNGLNNKLLQILIATTPLLTILTLLNSGFKPGDFPFGLASVAFIFPISIAVRYAFYNHVNSLWLYMVSTVVVATLPLYINNHPFNLATSEFLLNKHHVTVAFQVLFMFSMFFLLLKLSTVLAENTFLRFIGRHSLEIFLVHHLFDIILIEWIGKILGLPSSELGILAAGVAVFCITLTTSLLLARLSDKSKLHYLFHPPQMLTKTLKGHMG